ncbi:DUF3667 domain-containing protein [Vulcaniibacterium gelatinicum]|uniref:DUF3667 domain-containing protein n=1 Tax=Vulcaniibacterium gelatinicum TaxID=2598725 RepID=UPI0015F2D68A|nr:DUF3667 domain-containing protein [Vulcaniibacterium gelatinicum]
MTDTPAASADASASPPACQNCGTPLLGPHCYACGQPVKGLVRHFSSILGDFLDSVFNLDTRIVRTLGPLFARPGFLSLQYFAGHRVRYVSPVRLFFFLSLITFFVAQLALDFGDSTVRFDGDDRISRATTVEEVQRLRDEAVRELEQARAEVGQAPPGALVGFDTGIAAVRARAERRIAELERAQRRGEPPPLPQADKPELDFGNGPWHPERNPVRIGGLPGFANDWLNRQIGRAEKNIVRMQEDPSLFKDALLGAVPSTLFVLLPVFALMLKLAYLFKRRLYMEHLIVALHSHAFLCLALLGVFVLVALRRALGEGVVSTLLGWAETALFIWMPVYLLLMQKRVYGQGWFATLAKYCVLGTSYLVLLAFGAVGTVLASLVWM